MADEVTTTKRRGRPPKAPAAIEIPTDEWAKVQHRGPKPHFPVYGETWQEEIGGQIKYWHGTAWYLTPPGGESGTGEAALATMNAKAGADAGTAPVDAPGELADALAEAVDDGTLEELEVTAEVVEGAGEFEPLPEASDDAGDGVRESSPVIERLEHFADDLDFDPRSLVEDCRDFMLDLFKTRPKPWSATLEDEQRDIAAAIEGTMTDFVRKVVETVRQDGEHQPIRCLLEGYSEKDGIKATLKVRPFSEEEELAAVVGLHKAKGKMVLVTVASVDDYKGGRDAETDRDAPALDFEAGNEPDDEDLGDGEDQG